MKEVVKKKISVLLQPKFNFLMLVQIMGEKDVEAAGGSVGVCSDNIVVCGAIAEGVMIFLLIMIIILIIGFSAAWSVQTYSEKKHKYIINMI